MKRKAREQKEERSDQFFTTVITQLRGLLYDATTNVLASLKKHERLQPRAVVQLRNPVENLGLLNFYGDKDVERAMNKKALHERGWYSPQGTAF